MSRNKTNDYDIIKGDTSLSKGWSILKMAYALVAGIPTALVISAVVIPGIGVAKFLNVLNLHTRQYYQFQTQATKDPMFQKIDDLMTRSFFKVWDFATDPYIRPTTKFLQNIDRFYEPELGQVAEDLHTRLARAYGTPSNNPAPGSVNPFLPDNPAPEIDL